MLRDLRYSARGLLRTPGLSTALVLTIAIGIGSNAAVLGFIRGAVVTNERPASVTDRVVTIFSRDAQSGYRPLSFGRFMTLAQSAAEFEWLGAVLDSQVSVSMDGQSIFVPAAAVTPAIASWLQLDVKSGSVISTRLQATAGSSGTLRLNGVDVAIAGTAPEWLTGVFIGRDVDLWLPADETALGTQTRGQSLIVIGRLRSGVSLTSAQSSISRGGGTDELVLLPYTGAAPDAAAGLSQLTRLLPGAAVLVFFIACANVVAFLLSRSAGRAKETAVRVALGAGRRQMASALLADAVLITLAGGAAGLLLTMWTMDVVPAMFFEQDAAELRFEPDVTRMAITALICAVIVIVCGLLPLIDQRKVEPAGVLRRESAGSSALLRRLRRGLVVAQVAFCSTLIVTTGLLLDGFRSALRTAAGERAGEKVIARLEWPPGYDRPDLGAQHFRKAEAAALAVPAATGVAWAVALPGSPPRWQPVRIEPPRTPKREVVLHVASFTPDTVAGIRVPPVSGRLFGGRDHPGSCRVVVINEAAAAVLFDGDAVGRALLDPSRQLVEIVGIVTARRPDDPANTRPTVFYYAEQTGPPLGREGPATFLAAVLPPVEPAALLDTNVVSAGYFSVMDVAMRAGHVWTTAPSDAGCRVAVINQDAADRYFDGDAVGGAVIDESGRRIEMIGVVSAPPLRTSQSAVTPVMYLPVAQNFTPRMTLLVSARDADAAVADVRKALELDAAAVTTLGAHLARTSLAAERIATILIAVAATLAIFLAALGIYGAMADAVGRRRREFSLRIALGAQRWRVTAQVMREGLRLAAVGGAAGLVASIGAAYFLARISPASGTLSVWTVLPVPFLVGLLVVAACIAPARRALASDPLSVMREN